MMDDVMMVIFAIVNAHWKWIGPLAVGVFGAWLAYGIVGLFWMFVEDARRGE